LLAIVTLVAGGQPIDVSVTVTTTSNRHAISPLIYGVNNSTNVNANVASRRRGGDRLTTYNWENNASNSGHWTDDPLLDHISDALLTGYVPSSQPAKAITDFHDASLLDNMYSLVTLQAGYVARDIDGVVTAAEAVPNMNRWRSVSFSKGSSFTLTPDVNDDNVYMDELVNFLVNRYGPASSATGIKGYGISNEPGLWHDIHPRCHPTKEGYADIFAITTDLALAIKSVDPSAEVFGGVTFGFSEMADFQGAPDRNAYSAYKWYIDALLANMRKLSDAKGTRLVDVLDVHWYSEAEGNTPNMSVAWGGNEPDLALARVQAPRSLWDTTYVERSWITGNPGRFSHSESIFAKQAIALIPRLKESIAAYNPGTKLAFGEFGYGGYDHISGGLAVADVLGILGQHNAYYANHWDDITGYVESAYKLYRNYNGARSTFGDTSVSCATSDVENSSAYASLDSNGDLHIILINKNAERSLNMRIDVNGDIFDNGSAWAFDAGGTQVRDQGSVAITGTIVQYPAPPFSASHLVLPRRTSGVVLRRDTAATPSLSLAPNPFRSDCRVTYHTTDRAGTVSVFDMMGVLVRRFEVIGGRGVLVWNGTSASGEVVPSGVYCVAIGSPAGVASTKVVIDR